MEDVTGRRWIDTKLRGRVVVAEENAAAAIEVMSRFAVAPQWLSYLPPTMSPSETSKMDGWLERPEEAFSYFRSRGVAEVVCEEKHMGSRAVIAICRDSEVACRRFGGPATRPAKSGLVQAGNSLRTSECERRYWANCGRLSTRRVYGTSYRLIGFCWTLKLCLGRQKPAP